MGKVAIIIAFGFMLSACSVIRPITGSCGTFSPIFTHKDDTRRTKGRVARHNEKGVTLGCWKG